MRVMTKKEGKSTRADEGAGQPQARKRMRKREEREGASY